MSPMDVSRALPVTSADEFDRWLAIHSRRDDEVVIAIPNKASGRQTVSLVALQEVATCHGWVDNQTKRIDADRYGIRFVPRRAGSHWSSKNRAMAARLLAQGRITDAGLATLPDELEA
jgi:uncharacterized protein YdeI (YjbR/CyaY-like superfamily)